MPDIDKVDNIAIGNIAKVDAIAKASISKINGYTFDWKKYASKFGSHLVGKDYGVMADEIEEVMPELVHDRDNGYKGVKYEKIVPLLIECIKEQQVQINQLKKWKSDKKWI